MIYWIILPILVYSNVSDKVTNRPNALQQKASIWVEGKEPGAG